MPLAPVPLYAAMPVAAAGVATVDQAAQVELPVPAGTELVATGVPVEAPRQYVLAGTVT